MEISMLGTLFIDLRRLEEGYFVALIQRLERVAVQDMDGAPFDHVELGADDVSIGRELEPRESDAERDDDVNEA